VVAVCGAVSAQRRCLFDLVRLEDVTGVSGTGVVAWGAVMPDGWVALRWATNTASSCWYASLGDVEAIHGHDGRTVVRCVARGGDADTL